MIPNESNMLAQPCVGQPCDLHRTETMISLKFESLRRAYAYVNGKGISYLHNAVFVLHKL